jgi:hypothetical protein
MAFDKAVTQLGVAVGAQVVDGKDFALHAEQGNVLPLGRHCNACAFKQVGLRGHVGPYGLLKAHGQMG